MNSLLRFALIPFILAVPLCALAAGPSAPPAQPGADDAQALKVAELKLAALAKEGSEVNWSGPPGQQEPARNKPHTRKRHAASRKGKATAVASAKPQKVTNRRLTQSEVQGILATTRDFSGTDLSGMSLVGSDLNGAKFNRANLQHANLQRADLAETDLELADLTGADLRGASLNQARLRGTRLEGARIDGALWIDKTVCKKGSVGTCIE